MEGSGASNDLFEIVVICSGNRFRSPLVAAHLADVTKDLPVRVSSAGILDLGGVPPLEGAIKAGDELGIDLRGHRSRYVGNVAVDNADLVLGFERAHVTTAVVDGNAARERTFTLPELVWLLEHAPPPDAGSAVEGAREVIAYAHRLRDPTDTRLRQIDDPIGTGAREQDATARRLVDLTNRLARALFGDAVESRVMPVAEQRRGAWRERLRRRG